MHQPNETNASVTIFFWISKNFCTDPLCFRWPKKKSPLLKISWCTNSNILYFEFATCAHLPITRPPTIIPLLNC